ncbi:MAG: hypothetical protein V1810_01065 [Candidatus Beckwithbacteria bacterium]
MTEYPLAPHLNRNTEVLTVTEILHPGNFRPEMSLARIELDGENVKNRNLEASSLYIVVDGEGKFTIFGQKGEKDKIIKVKKGDSVFIAKGTWYQDSGNMTMYSICSPAWDGKKVEIAAA